MYVRLGDVSRGGVSRDVTNGKVKREILGEDRASYLHAGGAEGHLERVRPRRELPAVRAGLRRLRRAAPFASLQVPVLPVDNLPSAHDPAVHAGITEASRAQDLAEEDNLRGVGLDIDGLARAQRASQR